MSRLAFLVLAHADAAHLQALVAQLVPAGDVYLHIDAKADLSSFAALKEIPGVRFASHRHSIDWAGFSMVEATLGLMRDALAASTPYAYLVLLSGSCFPLRPLEELNRCLARTPGRQVIRYLDMRESATHYMRHINRRWFKRPMYRGRVRPLVLLDKAVRRVGNMLRLPNAWPEGVVPYFGSQWWALTADCCRYVLDFVDRHPEFVEANRLSFSPDEHFFHTIVGNSPFAAAADGLQPFEGVGTYRMANLHVIDPSLQRWFIEDDWPMLSASDKYFVRKVGSATGAGLVARIKQERLCANHSLEEH